MIVCRSREDYKRNWKISVAFNVSQCDIIPLELFKKTLQCGTMRKAGNDGWYFEVNALSQIRNIVIPFFDRFSLKGKKAQYFSYFREAAELLSQQPLSDSNYLAVLSLREKMNNGGKRRYSKERILRDYTPNLILASKKS